MAVLARHPVGDALAQVFRLHALDLLHLMVGHDPPIRIHISPVEACADHLDIVLRMGHSLVALDGGGHGRTPPRVVVDLVARVGQGREIGPDLGVDRRRPVEVRARERVQGAVRGGASAPRPGLAVPKEEELPEVAALAERGEELAPREHDLHLALLDEEHGAGDVPIGIHELPLGIVLRQQHGHERGERLLAHALEEGDLGDEALAHVHLQVRAHAGGQLPQQRLLVEDLLGVVARGEGAHDAGAQHAGHVAVLAVLLPRAHVLAVLGAALVARGHEGAHHPEEHHIERGTAHHGDDHDPHFRVGLGRHAAVADAEHVGERVEEALGVLRGAGGVCDVRAAHPRLGGVVLQVACKELHACGDVREEEEEHHGVPHAEGRGGELAAVLPAIDVQQQAVEARDLEELVEAQVEAVPPADARVHPREEDEHLQGERAEDVHLEGELVEPVVPHLGGVPLEEPIVVQVTGRVEVHHRVDEERQVHQHIGREPHEPAAVRGREGDARGDEEEVVHDQAHDERVPAPALGAAGVQSPLALEDAARDALPAVLLLEVRHVRGLAKHLGEERGVALEGPGRRPRHHVVGVHHAPPVCLPQHGQLLLYVHFVRLAVARGRAVEDHMGEVYHLVLRGPPGRSGRARLRRLGVCWERPRAERQVIVSWSPCPREHCIEDPRIVLGLAVIDGHHLGVPHDWWSSIGRWQQSAVPWPSAAVCFVGAGGVVPNKARERRRQAGVEGMQAETTPPPFPPPTLCTRLRAPRAFAENPRAD
mmetsp:Transcript_53239/g.169054  ORF Transcript_53239/g.169054 Transcript_53239/m.169054 type:complete len:765 (+) Transcript_53239:568-2862(+)